MANISEALKILVMDAEFTIASDAPYPERYQDINWTDSRTMPTEAEVQAEITNLETNFRDVQNLEDLRQKRNELLKETDWWGVSDRTMTQAETDYRQALRDITDTYSDLDTVVWPTKP